tara:strand:+ start:199 stop:516 length:318 start_codon:yes stop_codon:yes gene_type:complete
MIKLGLGVGEGDVENLEFKNKENLIDFILELDRFQTVWLVADEDIDNGEILVTESLNTIVKAVKSNLFNLSKDVSKLSIFDNATFEDAYSVSLSMKEGNPKCYCD